jgi:hypothetical protein
LINAITADWFGTDHNNHLLGFGCSGDQNNPHSYQAARFVSHRHRTRCGVAAKAGDILGRPDPLAALGYGWTWVLALVYESICVQQLTVHQAAKVMWASPPAGDAA